MQSHLNKEISINHTFKQTGLNTFLCKLLSQCKFNNPTPIQYYAIKTGISNTDKNIVCRSKSGTGKTLAYVSLILQYLSTLKTLQNKTYCVIFVPTRQLAVQVYQTIKILIDAILQIKVINQQQKRIKNLLKDLQLMLTIGGISFEDDRKKYRERPAHILITTIGRMWELCRNKVIVIDKNMYLVLDEGDKLLASKDQKFNKILSLLPNQAKWIVFSATYTRKILEELSKIRKFIYVQTLLKNDELQAIITQNIEQQIKNNEQKPQSQLQNKNKQSKQEGITQNVHLQNIKKYQFLAKSDETQSIFDSKMMRLKHILSQLKYQKCLIFVQKKSFLQQISQGLPQFEHVLIHGSLSQAARFRMMNKINDAKLIIASDLLSRGIDIKLDLVILFDAKQTETFWHRIGRTGRYGRTGVAISLDEIQDKQWNYYNSIQINTILTQIQLFQKKQWYGGHLTEIGKWTDVNEELQAQNGYKYFDQSLAIKQISIVQNQLQKTSTKNYKTQLNQFINIRDEKQLKQLIKNKILSCKKCLDLISATTELTGYKFQIFQFVKQGK